MSREQKEHELDILYNQWKDQKQKWEDARDNGNTSESYLDNLYITWRFTWRMWLRLFNELYPPEVS